MGAHPAFATELTDELAAAFHPGGEGEPVRPQRARSAPARRVRAAVRRVVRLPVAAYLDHRIASEMGGVQARVRDQMTQFAASHEERLRALDVNAEMLKAEVRAINRNLERLAVGVNAMAMAIAPTAGIDGVPERLAELRERLNAVERRTRAGSAPPAAASATTVAGGAAPASSSIDYAAFERRFRGDPAHTQAVTRERYLELLRAHGPVLDVGCGKGELIDALVQSGVEARGVDLDAGMVDEAQSHGLDVTLGDVNTYLADQPEGTFGAIISTQVVEHLQVDDLVRFLELSVTRLRPGGIFVAETPNPATLVVLGTHFILDPTHVRPIHPALMVFLCECAGFRSIDLRYFEPATEHHLPMLGPGAGAEVAERVNAAFATLNSVLFGPQDYAVVARTPEVAGA